MKNGSIYNNLYSLHAHMWISGRSFISYISNCRFLINWSNSIVLSYKLRVKLYATKGNHVHVAAQSDGNHTLDYPNALHLMTEGFN